MSSANSSLKANKKNSQSTQPTQETQETQQLSETQLELSEDVQEDDISSHWGCLLQIAGPLFKLTDRDAVYSVGTSPSNFIVLTGDGISRVHFQIRLEHGTRVPMPMIKDLSTNGTYRNRNKIGKYKEVPILPWDLISLTMIPSENSNSFRFLDSSSFTPSMSVSSTQEEHALISNKYSLVGDLGLGTTSIVKSAISNATGDVVAVKMIEKSKFPDSLREEIHIMKLLSQNPNSNTISIIETLENEKWMYIVLEYAAGKDLQNFVYQNYPTGMLEAQARIIFTQILHSLHTIHSLNMVHRDLKPDNILLVDKTNLKVKLSDFGSAASIKDQRLYSICGTPQYIAPEVYVCGNTDSDKVQGYSKEVDLWSSGILLYFLLSGSLPFQEDNILSVKDKILLGHFDFEPEEVWASKSQQVKSLIQSLLTPDPISRISTEEALQHPWIMTYETEEELSDERDDLNEDLDISYYSPPRKRQKMN